MGWEGNKKNFLVLAESVKIYLFLCKFIALFSKQKKCIFWTLIKRVDYLD